MKSEELQYWRGIRRYQGLLREGVLFEFRKAVEFRMGFVIREILHGLPKPLIMILVYSAIFQSRTPSEIRGYTFLNLVHYLILVAILQKIVFGNRQLDLAEQIFEGYITKYFVMPFSYFVLALSRYVQYSTVQLLVVLIFYTLGFLLFPQYWPLPVSLEAVFETLVLVLLGSYCFFLTYFIVNTLAFWLEVVWTLLIGVWFVSHFISGALIPVSLMPEGFRNLFYWTFPYWTISASSEIFLGKLHRGDFLEGLGILLTTLILLEALRRWVWRRGIRRYTGVGM
jgi:ABC-2 type transport system permease protein